MHAQANVMLNTIVIGNMYLVFSQEGQHTNVVRKQTFDEARQYAIGISGKNKVWIELEPYKQIEL